MSLSKIMLKCLCIFAILLNQPTSSFSQFHNQIDDVKTAADIDTILKHIEYGYYFSVAPSNPFKGDECQRHYDSLQIKTWAKGDFDNNGYTDLLVLGGTGRSYSILDSGVNKFFIKLITTYNFQCELFSVSPDSNFIIYHKLVWGKSVPYQSSLKEGKLVYKFGGILEYNEVPTFHKIQTIELSTGGEAGYNRIKINKNRKIRFQYFPIGKEKSIYHQINNKISKTEYQNIINYLNYMNFPSLKNRYDTDVLDAGSSTLKITYDNGQIKKITDIGSTGTYGLAHFYDLLLEPAYKLVKEKKIKRRTPLEARR